MKLFHIVLTKGQTCNSNILLHDQIVETLFSCHDDFPLHSEVFELFKCFRLMFHQVDIPISAQIICQGHRITIPAASLNIHRTAYISMYYFQQVSSSFHCSEERSFSHLAQKGTVRKHQMIHNQVIPKIHLYGVSSCALHRYDPNGSATNKLYYHY